MTKWLRFLRLRFFENPKKHDFLRFLRCCTRFLEHCSTAFSEKSWSRHW